MFEGLLRFLAGRRRRPPLGTTARDLDGDQRLVRPVVDRRSRGTILRLPFDKSSKVLEIGPLAQPIAAKADGYNVLIADIGSQQWLIDYYRSLGEDVSRIEPVDFVLKEDGLDAAVPAHHHGTFDAVVASHVLEHVPDPIAFLKSAARMLKAGGVLSLALPDKRFCFDMFRPLTTSGDWIDAHRQQRRDHAPRTLFETLTTSVAVDGHINWVSHGARAEDLTFIGRDLAGGYDFAYGATAPGYHDCHDWVFTPSSFALLAHEMHALGLCPLALDRITEARNGEFLVHLRAADKRPITHHERIQLMALAAREQAASLSRIRPVEQSLARRLLGR